MSCSKNVDRASLAAVRCGVSDIVSKTVANLKRNFGFDETLSQRQPVDYETISKVTGQAVSAPLELKDYIDKTCGKCQAFGVKPGAWYQIEGDFYCPDCAPTVARTNDVRLLVSGIGKADSGTKKRAQRATGAKAAADDPLTANLSVAIPKFGGQKKSTVKKLAIDIRLKDGRLIRVEDAYEHTENGEPTGLGIVPAVNLETGKKVPGYMLVHLDSGARIGGDMYSNVWQGIGAASLMTGIDWQRPLELLSEAEVKKADQLLSAYRIGISRHVSEEVLLWRKNSLQGQMVKTAFGELAYVADDPGEMKLYLAGRKGLVFGLPRNLVDPPTEDDLIAAGKIAVPVKPSDDTPCQGCNRRFDGQAHSGWYNLPKAGLFCDRCAPTWAKRTGSISPEKWVELEAKRGEAMSL